MFIVWGTRIVYRRLGFVADFCPICREPTAMSVRRIGAAGHLYYISVGSGKLVGYDRTCLGCKTCYDADPENYATLSKSRAPIAELQRTTFPDLERVLHDRLALEEKVKRTPGFLTVDERSMLIRSPFLLLSPKVEQRFAQTRVDRWIVLALLGMLSMIIAGAWLGDLLMNEHKEIAMLVMGLGGLVLVGWQIALSGRRYMRRDVIPALAKALQPLRPTRLEIEQVMAELKELKHKIGRKLETDDLFLQL